MDVMGIVFSAGLKAPGAIEYTEPVLSAFEPF
jgi:hypothetical protein